MLNGITTLWRLTQTVRVTRSCHHFNDDSAFMFHHTGHRAIRHSQQPSDVSLHVWPAGLKEAFCGRKHKIGKEKTSAVMTADQMLILQEVLEQKLKAYSCPLVVGSRCKVKGNT